MLFLEMLRPFGLGLWRDGRWSGQVWGRNVTNEYYYNNVTHLTDYIAKIAGMPATYGVTISFRY